MLPSASGFKTSSTSSGRASTSSSEPWVAEVDKLGRARNRRNQEKMLVAAGEDPACQSQEFAREREDWIVSE